jgi:hypothetical protein
VKKLAIILVIVFGLLVVADFGAASAAEYQVSKQMRAQLQLSEDPSVRINGFPFLAQAAMGDFRDVQLQAQAVKVGQLSEVGLEANLHHAKVSAADMIAGKANKLDVAEIVGRARLKSSDVGRLIGITDLTIVPAPKDALSGVPGGGSDRTQTPGTTVDQTKTTIQLDGSVNIAGADNKVRVIAVLSLLNGQMKIEPRKLELNNNALGPIPLPPLFQKSVLQQFTTTLDPGMLPFRISPTAVRAEEGALVVEGTAHDVTIGAGGMSSR